MTYITRLIWNESRFGSRIMATALAVLGILAMQSRPVHAQWTTNGNNISNTNTGNVGVGTTAPSTKLEVVGNINAKLAIDAPATTDVRHIFNGASAWLGQDATNGELDFGHNLYYNNGFKYRVASQAANIRMYQGAFQFQTAGTGAANAAITWTDRMVISANGSVGIGTASPELRLDTRVANSTTDYSNNLTYAGAFGNVSGKRITVGYDETGEDIGVIQSVHTGVGFKNLSLNPSGGNVGIGTPTPSASYKLDVNGATNVTGNLNVTGTVTGGTINAKYQDVAEWVQSSQQLPPGTVVVLDQTKSNQVIASSQAYDTRVAGVISSQPGITLGVNGEGKVLVATTGRVRIKVDASRGPIQVGDLLVTSDVAGFAMKSHPINVGDVQIHRPGTLIGKALEPLEKGKGEILVLLSLQ